MRKLRNFRCPASYEESNRMRERYRVSAPGRRGTRSAVSGLLLMIALLAGCTDSTSTERPSATPSDGGSNLADGSEETTTSVSTETTGTTEAPETLGTAETAETPETTGASDPTDSTISTSVTEGEPKRSAGCDVDTSSWKLGSYLDEVRQTEESTDTWMVRAPTGYVSGEPQALLFNFHGAGSNPAQQVLYSGFDAHADTDGAVIVAPKSRGAAWQPLAGPDAELIDFLLTDIPNRFCIDENRIYSTGMSSGAYTTATLACRHPDKVAAFAPVTANFYLPGPCGDAPAVDIMSFHGTGDPIVAFGDAEPVDGIPTKGGIAAGFATAWAEHDGCDQTPVDEAIGDDVTKRVWPACDAGGSVTFYVVKDGGHTWPGSITLPEARFGKTTKTISATDLIWEFLMSHTLGDG